MQTCFVIFLIKFEMRQNDASRKPSVNIESLTYVLSSAIFNFHWRYIGKRSM